MRVACVLLAESPVQAGGQPCAEVAPSLMGEEHVKERAGPHLFSHRIDHEP